MPRRTPTRAKRKSAPRRKRAAKKGWETRRKRERATKLARRYVEYHAADEDDFGPDHPTYPWDREEGWEPPEGWQGDDLAEEISYMTHEEKIDFLEYLAEQLDTTVHELFEMMGSP